MCFTFAITLRLVFSVMLSFFMVLMLNSQIVTPFKPQLLYLQTNIMMIRFSVILEGA